jgi:type I restriction enzyme S subunit
MTRKTDWTTVKFGDVVRLNTDRIADPEAEGIERYVGIEHIEPEDLRIRSWGLVAEGTTFTNHFRPGQVLFVKRRAYQRKVAVAEFEGVCSGDIYVLEPRDDRLLPDLLPFICQTDAFFAHAVNTSAGSLSPRTNWKQLAQYEFALPPLAEQRRIAEMMSELTNLQHLYQEALNNSRKLLAAMLNELTESDDVKANLPSPVCITELGLNGEAVLKTGPFGSKLKTSFFRPTGIPVINIGALQDDGLDPAEFFYLDTVHESEFEAYKTKVGDIVFSRVADVGRCHLITEQDSGFIISSNLIRIRVDDSVIRPMYLWLLLKYSKSIRQQIAKVTTQAAGRLLVNTQTMRKLKFLIPTLEYQDYVVSRCIEVQNASIALTSRVEVSGRLVRMMREQLLSEDAYV